MDHETFGTGSVPMPRWLFALIFMTVPALAEDCAAPCAGHVTTLQLGADWIAFANPASLRSIDVSPTVESELWFAPADGLKFAAEVIAEPVIDKEPGHDRFFEDTGAYVNGLYAEIDLDPVSITIGKYAPGFSLASESLEGLHDTDLAANFDTDERWGLGATLPFEAPGLDAALTADVFTTDRTVLSDSLFTSRGRTRLRDGGTGNTSGLSSFALRLDACADAEPSDCYEDGSFGIRLAARHQRKGLPAADQILDGETPHAETALLGAAMQRLDLAGHPLRLIGELGYIDNFEGGSNDALIGTLAAAYEVDATTYRIAWSEERDFIADEADANQHLVDVTVSHELGEALSVVGKAWTISAGYSFAHTSDGEDSQTLGLELSAEIGGDTGGSSAPD